MSLYNEPWTSLGGYDENIYDSNGRVMVYDAGWPEGVKERILACVNACEGVPMSVLEQAAECAAAGKFGTAAAKYKSLLDESIEALGILRALVGTSEENWKCLYELGRKKADEILEKYKKEQW